MKTLFAMMVMASALWAQTAKVVSVDAPTAAQLKALSNAAKDAQSAYENAMKAAEKRLLTSTKHTSCFAFREGEDLTFTGTTIITSSSGTIDLSGGSVTSFSTEETPPQKAKRIKRDAEHPEYFWLDGFCNGSEFTEDFRYLVPATANPVVTGTTGSWAWPGGYWISH